MENNTSGKGEESDVPFEIQGWSWGAFLLSWIWGIGNNTYRAFWVFFPFVNLIMIIALGLKGNEWAWRHRKWESIEHFKLVQKKWTKAALIVIASFIVLFASMMFGIGGYFKDSEPFKQSIELINSSTEVVSRLGVPYEVGFVSGSMSETGPDGTARFSYSVEGSSSEAVIVTTASMEMLVWSVDCLIVYYEDSDDQTILVPCE